MTRIVYLGAEVPSNRILLESAGVRHVGFSFYRLLRRGIPKKGYRLEDHFDDGVQIYLHPGLPADPAIPFDEFSDLYEGFVAENIDRVTLFTEIDSDNLAYVENQRKTCWSEVPPGKFLPVWNPSTGFSNLNLMAERYLDIGIPGSSFDDPQTAVVVRNLTRQGTRFHILGSAKPDLLRNVPAETTSTLSWLSPMMNGETIVWDGVKLMRYPKRMKDQARTRYRNVYTKAGLDVDKILEDDPKEVCRLALWSYQQYEARNNGVNNNDDFLSDNSEGNEVATNAETTPSHIDKKPLETRKLEARLPHEMGNLPIFGYDVKAVVNDDGVIEDVTSVRSQSTSLRACDTCFVASNCPAFKPQTMCAFNLPVEVKTKDHLKALLNAIIEMQGQRVAFMRFAEEMSGGYADPNVSQEIDRLFKLIKTTKELDDSREFIRMTVERQGSAGVLSSIFGDKANVLKELPNDGLNEEQTTKIIRDLTEE